MKLSKPIFGAIVIDEPIKLIPNPGHQISLGITSRLPGSSQASWGLGPPEKKEVARNLKVPVVQPHRPLSCGSSPSELEDVSALELEEDMATQKTVTS